MSNAYFVDGKPETQPSPGAEQTNDRRPRTLHRWVTAAVAGVLLAGLSGCEVNSFFDPSVVGRWDRTPVVLPILNQLDVIDEPTSAPPGLSQVRPSDLIATPSEYRLGPGDTIQVSVYELLLPNQEDVEQRRLDEMGMIRLPVIGPVQAGGLTTAELEKKIAAILDQKGVLKNASVSVLVLSSMHNTFSVIGEAGMSGTQIGTYPILRPDFRLMDAMAMARGAAGNIKTIYVIRQVRTSPTPATPAASTSQTTPSTTTPTSSNPSQLIEQLYKGLDQTPSKGHQHSGKSEAPNAATAKEAAGPTPPTPLESGLESAGNSTTVTPWVQVNGKWVHRESNSVPAETTTGNKAKSVAEITQRVIEIPYDKLLAGNMRYNIVIRPGDIIRVPAPQVGNVFIGGAIARPGTYGLPGDQDMDLKQLVIAAGGLAQTAMPDRVELIRRIGKDQEATVRVNLRAIFDGREPDFFLKPNDTINIGTSFVAMPLAILRNGFRASYGFGFILDRNFGYDLFGPQATSYIATHP